MHFKIPAIICATDLSEDSYKAVHFAAYLCQKYQAKLVAVNIIDWPTISPYGETIADPKELRDKIEHTAKIELKDILAAYPDIDWSLEIALGYPAREIEKIALQYQAGIVIAASHSRSGIERLLLGSVSQKLLHTLTVPFIIIPSGCNIKKPYEGNIKTVMVASDFSADAQEAINWGLKYAEQLNSKLILATVIEPTQLNQLNIMDPNSEHSMADQLKNQLSEQLNKSISDEDRRKYNPQIVVLAGKPHEELNKFAILNNVDLIIMGIHGRGFIESLLVGSTTDRLIRLAQVPVMAVRNEEE